MHIYIYISFNISKDWTTLPTSIQHAHEAASLLSPPKKHETLNIAVLSWKGASSSNQFFSCHFRGPFLLFVGCIFYLYSLLICFPSFDSHPMNSQFPSPSKFGYFSDVFVLPAKTQALPPSQSKTTKIPEKVSKLTKEKCVDSKPSEDSLTYTSTLSTPHTQDTLCCQSPGPLRESNHPYRPRNLSSSDKFVHQQKPPGTHPMNWWRTISVFLGYDWCA